MRVLSLTILLMLLAAWGLGLGAIVSQAEDLPERAIVEGVLGRPQTYTLSCESRSAVDWARFWGASISETEFLSRLPRSDNPNVGFVGDPNGLWGGTPPYSYGVHAYPVADLLREYGLDAEAHEGLSWDELRMEIANGRPVIVWVVGQMWGGNSIEYTASDGEVVRVAAFEHTMILVGYDEATVQAIDASTGWQQNYPLKAFLRSWSVLGNMAITGSGWIQEEPPEDAQPVQVSLPPTATLEPPSPAPTATLTAYAFLMLTRPRVYYFPLIYQDHDRRMPPPSPHEVVAAGVCLYTRKGVLIVQPLDALYGWCLSPLAVRPEYFLRLAGSIPELP